MNVKKTKMTITRSLPLGAKGRLCSTFGHSVALYGSGICHVKEGDVIRQQRNNARVVQWISNVKSEDTISFVQLKHTLQLNTMKECLL